jgi:protein gp37
MMDLRYHRVTWGAGEARIRTSPSNWKKPLAWNRQAEAEGSRPRVFCASLADVFDNEVDERWRADLFALIEATPRLVWMLLTKRIGNVLKMTGPARGGCPLPRNVAIGCTFANQDEYDRDKLKLWEVARLEPLFTFGSYEPLLGAVYLDQFAPDLIIAGGETDQGTHKAREADPQWFRTLRDDANRLGRKFFMKQMSRKAAIPEDLMVREWPEVKDHA